MSNLLYLFLIPIITSLIALITPAFKYYKRFIFGLSLLPLAFLIYNHSTWIGSEINYVWFPSLSIHFHLKVDPLSLLFLYLTAVIVPISISAVRVGDKLIYSLILASQALLFGFFMARDLAVFTIFWEAMLLPLFFIIALWGGPLRQAAALKFLIYMFAGSVLMIAAVLALYFSSEPKTFDLDLLAQTAQKTPYVSVLFAIFLLAFAVKTPLFPFHAWLPDAYYQAPFAGSILLSGLLSKAGIYGILRIGIELFSPQMIEWSPVLLGFAIVGVFYGGFAAWMQDDFKRLIAYSSFSHVNFILAGLFIWNETAHAGAILQAINHGITITALFLVAYWLAERLGTTSLRAGKGLAAFMPHLCWLTLFFVLASVALPGLNNFVGEFLIFFGLMSTYPGLVAILGASIILSAVYMLRWMQKMYFEELSSAQTSLIDIRKKNYIIALPLVALILWLGIYPAPVLEVIKKVNVNTKSEKIE